MDHQNPRIRTVQKYQPPYPLNKFPTAFAAGLAKEVVYLLAARGTPRLEGEDWEEIFARLIGAKWTPSNVGLDDVVLQQTAWGAKTVKNKRPSTVSKIRLICGRNSPGYSYGVTEVTNHDPGKLGDKILEIWNERVTEVRKRFKHCRTVVLIKSDNLLEVAVFEFETVRFICEDFWWQWNDRENLEGYSKANNEHRFTWQPHGSQFTVIENIPESRLAIRIKQPPILNHEEVLKHVGFDETWYEII